MSIETAVIPVAGAGTRMFPATESNDKCTLPVYAGDLAIPIVHYMLADVASQVRRVIFVTTERGQAQLEDSFGEVNPILQDQLRASGKAGKIDELRDDRAGFGVKIEYIIQKYGEGAPYGTAVPPFLAKNHLIGEESFAVMGGDDFVYHPDGTSELGLAIAEYDLAGTDHLIMGKPSKRIEVADTMGVFQYDESGRFIGIDERPPIKRVPKNPVANISRYIFSDQIWDHVEAEMIAEHKPGEEYKITNVINFALAADQSFATHTITGTYLDGGSPKGMREASNYITKHPPFAA